MSAWTSSKNLWITCLQWVGRTINIQVCQCQVSEPTQEETAKQCQWPEFHSATSTLRSTGEIKGVLVIDEREVRGRMTCAAATASTSAASASTQEDESAEVDPLTAIIQQVSHQLQNLADKLAAGLKDDVYKEEDEQLVANSKTICDLSTLQQAVNNDGTTKVVATSSLHYIQAIRRLPVRSLAKVPDDVLIQQFNKLCMHLENLPSATDSKDIIKALFKLESGLYKGTEMILHAVTVAAVSISVESILESLVSRYEGQFDKTRTLLEERGLAEMEEATNGPNLGHCDDVVKSAMNMYWSSRKSTNLKWHFVKTGIMGVPETWQQEQGHDQNCKN